MTRDSRCTPSAAPRFTLVVLLLLASAHGAVAATFQVTSLSDSGPGSLRQAVLNANASAGPDEVTFAPGLTGTIELTSGQIGILDDLVIQGPGAWALTVTPNKKSRIFFIGNPTVAPIDVTLANLTLTGGYTGVSGAGGAIWARRVNLTILASVISDSTAVGSLFPPSIGGPGGNVCFESLTGESLRIADSTLTRGSGEAGSNLFVGGGKLILERSTISDGAEGTGLFAENLTEDSTIFLSTISGHTGTGIAINNYIDGAARILTIEASTISDNMSETGGGIYALSGNLRIINSTISGNTAASTAGGIYMTGGGSLLLRLSTLSNNTAFTVGGNIVVGDPSTSVELDHAIVANGSPQDLYGQATVTANYSLIEAPGAVTLLGGHNLVGVDPLLGPLANNGGPTLTHAPLPGSPVLDAGDPAIPSPPATDQRGFARIFGPAVDLGSVEQQPQPLIAEVPTLSQVGAFVLSLLLLALGVRRVHSVTDRPPARTARVVATRAGRGNQSPV